MGRDVTVRASLDEPVVLILGGSSGMGIEVCRILLRDGYHVVVASRRAVRRLSTASPFSAPCSRLDIIDADIREPAQLDKVLTFVEDRHGHLDGLVVSSGESRRTTLLDMNPRDVESVVRTNLEGPILSVSVFLKLLDRGVQPSIVFVSSAIVHLGMNDRVVYAASKAGIDGAVRALAVELGPRGVRVNAVAPGMVRTELTRGLAADKIREIERSCAMGRLASTYDVAAGVQFLLSNSARFVTGQVLCIDGGQTCGVTV